MTEHAAELSASDLTSSQLPRTHVLFVHGVGAQSTLSSLLRPYLNLRDNTRAGVPTSTRHADLISEWAVTDFGIHLNLPTLVLTSGDPPRQILFYEVHYSHLSEVIRDSNVANVTKLFIDFSKAVAIALNKLEGERYLSQYLKDNIRIGRKVYKIADTVLASSAPILRILNLFGEKPFVGNPTKAFERFFADITTFALDSPGSALITKHFEKTIALIRKDGFDPEQDELVIAAHSLGSVIAHNYLVRHWQDDRPPKMKLITFGSPIGLLTWLWRFVDHEEMNPDKWIGLNYRKRNVPWAYSSYFVWENIGFMPGKILPPVKWVNVVNAMDPIATAFQQECVFLGANADEISCGLVDGKVDHKFVESRSGFPHAAYYQDRPLKWQLPLEERETFMEILLGFIGMKSPLDARPSVKAEEHWHRMRRLLRSWYFVFLVLGWVFFALYVYLGIKATKRSFNWNESYSFFILLGYLCPPLVIWVLAASQKWIWAGASTKFGDEDIYKLSFAYSYKWRHFLMNLLVVPKWLPVWLYDGSRIALSTVFVMFLLIVPIAHFSSHTILSVAWALVTNLPLASLAILAGACYLLSSAVSEFLRYWRKILVEMGLGKPSIE